jgi:hypothetical protein
MLTLIFETNSSRSGTRTVSGIATEDFEAASEEEEDEISVLKITVGGTGTDTSKC